MKLLATLASPLFIRSKLHHLGYAAMMAVALTATPSVLFSAETNAVEDSASEEIVPGRSLAGNYLAARVALRDADTENAATFYRSTLEFDPNNNEIKLQAFQAFVANGNFSEGVELAQQLSRDRLAPPIARIVLAVDHLRSKAWSSAENELEGNWRSALDRLLAGLVNAWSQVGDKRIEEALATVDALEGPAWFDLFVQYHGGLIALHAGDTKEAIRRLEEAFANTAGGQGATQTYMRAARALAFAHSQAGDAKKAEETVAASMALQPQNPVFEALMARLKAGEALSGAVASPLEGAAEVMLNIGTAINKDGGEQFARIYLQLAHALAPNSDVISVQLADLYDGQKQLARANDLFRAIEEGSPFYSIAQLEIALNLDEAERLDDARVLLDKLISENPDDMSVHLSYGAVLARHEKWLEAIPVYQKLIDRIDQPQTFHWPLFYRQGIAFERSKQWPKAEAAFRKALELSPDQASVLNYLGYSWIDMNVNLQEGLDMIRKAVSLRPNDGYIVDSLGWAYYRLGRYQEAVRDLERAVALRPGDPTINDHLGDAYWRAKRRLEATFQWRHALALDPPEEDIERIQKKLDEGLPPKQPKVANPDEDEKKPDQG